MKNDTLLALLSITAVWLTSCHLADDIMRGFEPSGIENLRGIAILSVWFIATLMWVDWRGACYGRRRRALGYTVVLLGSLLALVIPALHFSGRGVAEVIPTAGGYFFIWTLWALGITGGACLMFALLGFWSLRRPEPMRS
ncbi:MAG: hypothetical protein ACT4NL_00330 [Pseudomarimonas sp.]